MAERALDHAMEKTHADNGTIVVQDVHTGQILALAIRPTFNPNDFRHTTPALLKRPRRQRRLRARLRLQARHLLLGARPARGQARRHDRLPGRPDHARRPRHSRRQGEHYGVVPVHKALEESSDVAAVKLALKVGPDRFYQYIRDFGFGSRTGVNSPARRAACCGPRASGDGSSIGSIAIGQEVGVTPAATRLHGLHDRQRRNLSAAARSDARPDQPPMAQPGPQLAAGRSPSSSVRICPIRCPPARIASSPR